MTKCDDVACNITKAEALVDCSSPFCQRKFHLSCANLKGKKKGELNSIYFLCNVCLEFIKFSNSNVENKLNDLEAKLGELIKPINTKLQSIESEFKKSIKELADRIDIIENCQSNQKTCNSNIHDKIDSIEQKISIEINELKANISKIQEDIKSYHKQNDSNQKVDSTKTNYPHKQQHNRSQNGPLLNYQIRVFGVQETTEDLSRIDRKNYDKTHIEKILKHLNKEHIQISDCYRLGKYSKENKHSRTLLVTFSSVWDKDMVLQSANSLATFNQRVFLSPALSDSDRLLERKILKKRWELINSGNERKDVKINNLKLYLKGNLVDITTD